MPSQARGTPGKSGKKTPNNPRPIKTNDIIVAAITILLYHIVRPSAPTPKKVSCKDRRFSIPADRAPASPQASAGLPAGRDWLGGFCIITHKNPIPSERQVESAAGADETG